MQLLLLSRLLFCSEVKEKRTVSKTRQGTSLRTRTFSVCMTHSTYRALLVGRFRCWIVLRVLSVQANGLRQDSGSCTCHKQQRCCRGYSMNVSGEEHKLGLSPLSVVCRYAGGCCLDVYGFEFLLDICREAAWKSHCGIEYHHIDTIYNRINPVPIHI